MAFLARTFRVWWACACDPDAYNGFNVTVTLADQNPYQNPISQVYVKPTYNKAGIYYYDFVNFIVNNSTNYEVWVQAVSYNGKESMWHNTSGVEIPDDGVGILGSGFSAITQVELDEGLLNKTIDGANTSIVNIDGGNITANTINANSIIAGTIQTQHLQAGSINADRIQAGTIQTQHLQAGSINADRLQAGTIEAIHIMGGTITGDLIQAGTINASLVDIIDLSVSGLALVNQAYIGGVHIYDNTITATKVNSSDLAVSGLANITEAYIGGVHIGAGVVDATHIKAESIDAGHIKASSITASRIDISDLFSVNANVTGVLTVSGGGQINLGNGNILASGSITATSGRIGNWIIGSDKLQSNADTANRIELNQTLSRISIISDTSQTKVAMGYLGGLPKNDSSGDYTVADYGFWAAPGDTLHIDGDAEYTSGDWVISHDSAYLVKDSSNNTIIRIGSDGGAHGVHVYDVLGSKLAEYSASKILIGEESGGNLISGLRYTTLNGLEVVGNITVSSQAILDAAGWTTLPEDGATRNIGILADLDSVSDLNITSISGSKIMTGTVVANAIASNQLFVGHSMQSSNYVENTSGWKISNNGSFYFYGDGGKYLRFNGTTFELNVPITITSSAMMSAAGWGQLPASGATRNTGALADMSSVSDSYITSISGGKISTGTIAVTNTGVSLEVRNNGVIRFYKPDGTHSASIASNSASGMSIYGNGIQEFNCFSWWGALFQAYNVTLQAQGGSMAISGASVSITGATYFNSSISSSSLSTGNATMSSQTVGGYSVGWYKGTLNELYTLQNNYKAGWSWDGSSLFVRVGSTFVLVGTASDSRLKEAMIPISDGVLDKFNRVTPINFKFKGKPKEEIGLIAQDVSKEFPEAVSEWMDGYLSVNYAQLVPYLIKAVQELSAEVNTIKESL